MKETVLVTGASRGLGKHIAIEFAKLGYNLLISGRDHAHLSATRREALDEKIESCEMIVGDIKDSRVRLALIDAAVAAEIEILVNNAGVYSAEEYVGKPAVETPIGEYHRIMDTNFFAPVALTNGVLPMFLKRGSGLVLNINSVAGKQGSACESAYAASKHALKGYSDSLRLEVTKPGVRVVDVYSGAMATQMAAGRGKDMSKLIDPREAASFIVRCCKNYESMCPNEITIGRRRF